MIYITTFEIHRDCQVRNLVFHCEAKNAKEADAIAKDTWKQNKGTGHQFHVHSVKSNIQNQDLLRVRNWKGQTVAGSAVMNKFFCLDFRTWRVNGQNVYGA